MRRMPRGPKPPSINLSEKQQTILQKIEQSRQSVHSLGNRSPLLPTREELSDNQVCNWGKMSHFRQK